MSFTIERGIPIPPPRWPTTKWPYRSMELGDSFFVPVGNAGKNIYNNARAAAQAYGQKISIRKIDGGWRIWRTA